jgi:hypothetical protein
VLSRVGVSQKEKMKVRHRIVVHQHPTRGLNGPSVAGGDAIGLGGELAPRDP